MLHRVTRTPSLQSFQSVMSDALQWAFSGISTFAHLPHVRCLTTPEEQYDVAVIGVPFDTTVSYRPGQLKSRVLDVTPFSSMSFALIASWVYLLVYTSIARCSSDLT